MSDERAEGRFALAGAAALLVLAVLRVAFHEPWRDELHAWLFARNSSSLLDLAHNLRYEGHPILWYLPLWGLARLTANPVAMQVLLVAISTATAWVVLRHAPFSRVERVLLVLGYFFFYE